MNRDKHKLEEADKKGQKQTETDRNRQKRTGGGTEEDL